MSISPKASRHGEVCVMPVIGSSRVKAKRPLRFNQPCYWLWCFTDDKILRRAWNAVSKDSHQRRAGRKVSDRARNEACVRPAADRGDQEKNNLAVLKTAQLHDRIIAR